MKSVVLMATILVSLIFSSLAFAGGTPATPKTLRVTVKTQQGQPLSGVAVTLGAYMVSGKGIIINKTVTTNTSGVVEFSNVNFGTGSNESGIFKIVYKSFEEAMNLPMPAISNGVIDLTITAPASWTSQ